MSKKTNQKNFILLVIAFLMLLLIIIFILLINEANNRVEVENNQDINVNVVINSEEIVSKADELELEKIKSMNERTRIEYYVARYINLLEQKDYEKAYKLLNSDYKKNYFKTQKEFEDYCNTTFSSMLDVQYDNFERNGQIYVVWLTITDALNGNKNSGKEMNFVIKENSFNDYELSFSKI